MTDFLFECLEKRGGGVWKSQSGGVDDFLEGTRSQVFFSGGLRGPKAHLSLTVNYKTRLLSFFVNHFFLFFNDFINEQNVKVKYLFE